MSKKQTCFCDTRLMDFKNFPEYKDFIRNVKASLLLVLLEKNYISRWEYDDCIKAYKIGEEGSLQ